MKTFKKILVAIAIFVILLLVIALFVKQDYIIERSILINRANREVFDYVKYLKNQNNYNKWNLMDPAMTKTYGGIDASPGFVYAWASNDKNVGVGEQEIIKIDDGERIDYEIRFIKPFASTQQAYMTTAAVAEAQTLVRWGFIGRMNYPSNLMLLLMDFEAMIGDDLETSLNNLKVILETPQMTE